MEFRVNDLLDKNVMKEAHYLGSERGLTNQITGVTVLESPDIAEWLQGGELILTSLFPIQGYTDEQLCEWIELLSKKKISGLVIKIQRVFDEIPPSIIAASEAHQLPIIQLPKDIPFIEIMYPVMEELFNKEVTKLTYFKEVHDRFTALSLADKGTEKIIETLENLIGNKAALFDNNFRCIAATDNRLSLFQEVEEMDNKDSDAGSKFPFYWMTAIFPKLQERKMTMKVVPIETINNIKVNLVIFEINQSISPFDVIAIESAATALELELVKQFAVAEVEQKYKNDLIDDLISGKKQSPASIYDRANVIGLDVEGKYAAALFQLQHAKQQNKAEAQRNESTAERESYRILGEAIEYYLPKSIIRRRSDRIILLWKMHQNNDNSWAEKIKKTAKQIQMRFNHSVTDHHVQIGIGNVAQSISDLVKSYKEAQDALELGQLYEQNDFVIHFDELGIYRLLYQFEDLSDLKNFIPDSLDTLMNYKHSIKNDLIMTLKMYLQCNQNAGKTAQRLFVHHKTVAYRIDRIKEITGIDFDNAEEMLAVQVGLKIMDVLDKERLFSK